MELAGLELQEDAFDAYARELAAEQLNPWVRSHYLLFLGEGFARLGRIEAAEDALKEASEFANANQIHQIAFKAQTALQNVRSLPRTQTPTLPLRSEWVPEEVGTVVRAISELRKTAVAAA